MSAPVLSKGTAQFSATEQEGLQGKVVMPRKQNCDNITHTKASKQRAAGRPILKVFPAEGRKAAHQVTKVKQNISDRGRGKARQNKILV